jgi:glucose/arabinose dehydrogenase
VAVGSCGTTEENAEIAAVRPRLSEISDFGTRVREIFGKQIAPGSRTLFAEVNMRVVGWVAILSALSVCPAFAQLSSQLVVSGLTFPVAVVQDPTQPAVQFVVEQGGRIRVVRNGQLDAIDFLDLTPLVLSGGERGLLGLAFAPDYASSRRFFVNYTRQPDGHTVIARYLRSAGDPLRADPSSAFPLRWPDGNEFITQPFANHNGGDLQFGSDGFLYIPLGDGGSGNDPAHRAQNPAELLGKVLRIDVNVPEADAEGYNIPAGNPFLGRTGFRPEIWAFGLRNPYRFTVDALERGGTGALVIGDVGQASWEEVNYEPFGAGGRNYGWRNREGAHDNVLSMAPAFTPLIDPFLEYSHAVGNVITGGVVYRGTDLGIAFFGRYFYADFGARRIWSVGVVVNAVTGEAQQGQIIEHTSALGGSATIGNVSGFGLGAGCEILFLNWSAGQLRRIVNASGPARGCPTSPDPFLGDGGGVFVDGTWVSRDHPLAVGAGLGGLPTGGCATIQPTSTWICVNGGWVPADHPLAVGAGGSGSEPPAPTPPGGEGTGSSACTTVRPAPNWVCVNGGWLPPDHPLALGSGSGSGTPPPPTGGTGSPGCTTVRPALDWVCVNGGWVPPDHPLATGGSPPG